MKSSFKLLAIIMFATPYTMMHASASEEQPTTFLRSAYDELEKHKQECILTFIEHEKKYLPFKPECSSPSNDSDSSDSSGFRRFKKLTPTRDQKSEFYAHLLAKAIARIQEMQIQEAKLAQLQITRSRSRAHSR